MLLRLVMTGPPWRPRSRTQYIKGCNLLGALRLGPGSLGGKSPAATACFDFV